MALPSLRGCRSLLFLPASNVRAIAKARGLEADLVILDLEDSVKAEDKRAARRNAVDALAEGMGGRRTAIRINPPDQEWHADDLVGAAGSAAEFIVLPKVEAPGQAEHVAAATGKPVIAMIESAAGVLAGLAVARASAGLIAGTNDLAADLGIPSESGRAGLVYSLQTIVVAARATGIAVFDGVYNRLEDEPGLRRECAEGRSFGFDGKAVIHPNQIGPVNEAFSPSLADVEAARRLLASARGGAERFEGRMIEAMHVAEAEAVLARAGDTGLGAA